MRGKKGQLNSLVGIIGTLIVIGLLIGSGLLVLQKFSEDDSLFESQSVVNESGGYINTTGYTLDSESGGQTRNFVITEAWNVTTPATPVLLLSGNYTINARIGFVTNASATAYPDVNFSYTFDEGQESWQGINSTLEATTIVPDLLGLIILIVMVGIILAIVFNVIPTGRASGA